MNDGTKDLIEALHAMRNADERRRRTEPGSSAHADAEQEIERLVDRIFSLDGAEVAPEEDEREDHEQRSA